jgi:3-oxoacyl-[acyl-carrier protein] reductase
MSADSNSVKSTAVITGANRGIGKGVAEAFAAGQSDLVLCVRNNNSTFENYCKELEKAFQISVFPVSLDLSSPDSIKLAVKTIHGLGIKINTLVNNAGIATGSHFQLTSEKELREVFETNFFGTYLFTQGMSKILKKGINSSIVNISSVSALDPKIGTSVYGASKAALNYASLVMAQELVKFGIRVNVVAPGITETDMYHQISESALPDMLKEIAMGRPAQVNEIAEMVVFLSSEKASYITGQIIRVDGGRM